MAEAPMCICYSRAAELRETGFLGASVLEELVGLLHCTQRDHCHSRHACSDLLLELIVQACRT